jgi:hypothetical protein
MPGDPLGLMSTYVCVSESEGKSTMCCCREQDVKKLSLQSAQARLGNFVLAFSDANLR